MSVITEQSVFVDGEGFTTATELRAAHGTLLRQESDGSNDELFLSNIRLFLHRGIVTGLFLDNERERRASQSILDYWATVLYRGTGEVVDSTLSDFDIERAPELPEDRCPYLGLESFGEQQHVLFFGRERVVQHYLKHLEEHRLLAVVGQSGSGKSSLVLAGLLPKLHEGALQDSSTWAYTPRIVPGKEPLVNLAGGLFEFLVQQYPHARKRLDAQRSQWVERFVAGTLHDSDYLVRQANTLVKTPLVLVVDQFEELFTICENEAARQAFIANLLALIDSPGLRHVVILTMRSEYASYVARFQKLNDAFDTARLPVAPMVPSELREAIEEPARSAGLKIEPSVVDDLVADVVGEPAALPLLQFTLLKLWESRERNRVTREAYQRLGGGRIALERSADEFYDGLSPEQQTTVRRLLLRMVRPADGLEFTNNRVQISELQLIGEPIERIDEVLNKLVAARLIRLTPGQTWSEGQVEVAHEALVRNWQKLSDWLEQARKQLRQRQNLTRAAEQWQSLGRDMTALLRGRTLKDALDMDTQELTKIERDFLRESELARLFEQQQEIDRIHALAEARRQQIEADRQRALAEATIARQNAQAERQRAEERSLTAKRLKRFATRLVIALCIALFATILALVSFFDANKQRIVAEEQRTLAQNAQGTADASRHAAERIAIAESNAHATSDVAGSIAVVARNTAVSALKTAEADALKRATAQAEAQTAAAQARAAEATAQIARQTAEAIAANNAERAAQLATANAIQIADLQQAQQAQATQQAGTQSLQNRERAQELATQSLQETEPLRALQLAEAAANLSQEQPVEDALQRAIQLYLVTLVGTVGQGNGAITQISWNPDSKQFVTSSSDASAQTWEINGTSGIQRSTFSAGSGIISTAWSPDGQRVASAGSNGVIGVWDPITGKQLIAIEGHHSGALSVAWSPDSRNILSTGSDNTIRLWDAGNGAPVTFFTAPGARVTWAAWSPDGQHFVSFAENTASVWRQTSTQPEFTFSQPSNVRSATWAPDGRTILTAAADGTVRIWDATNGTQLNVLEAGGLPLNSAMWSPSGMSIVAAGEDGTMRIWNTASGKELSHIQINTTSVTFAGWSPDSRRIVSGSSRGELRAYYVYFGDIPNAHKSLLNGREIRP